MYYFRCPNSDATEGSNVALTVVRSGQLGTVMVFWKTGLPNATIANGSITPEEGSILMTSDDTSAIINLLVCDSIEHLIYVLALPISLFAGYTTRASRGPRSVCRVPLSAASHSPDLPCPSEPTDIHLHTGTQWCSAASQ